MPQDARNGVVSMPRTLSTTALHLALRFWLRLQRSLPVRVPRVVLIENAGLAGNREFVSEDLVQPVLVTADDDQLLAFDAAPDLMVHPLLRQGVRDRAKTDGLVVANGACLAKRCGVRLDGQRVHQHQLFFKRLCGYPTRLAMLTTVEVVGQRVAPGQAQIEEDVVPLVCRAELNEDSGQEGRSCQRQQPDGPVGRVPPNR